MKKILILFIIVVVLFIGGYFWWQNGISPVNRTDISKKSFTVKRGEGIKEISYNLKNQGFIRDPIVFFLLVKKLGLDGKIQAGNFTLSPSMKTETIADSLTHGTVDIWVTIPEGKRANEIADIIQEKDPNYLVGWRNKLNTQEGYLFPDTYLIPSDADIDTIISLMKKNFEKKFSSIKPASNSAYTQSDIVTIASLIEREAKFELDRPIVASILYNRLQIGMPLQIDATVQFALGYSVSQKTWWKNPLNANDLKLNSPYNTYLNPGIPPTPIANPGLSSLEASVNPAKTDYLYYISDKSGHLHYAKTLDEHNANIVKYGLQ